MKLQKCLILSNRLPKYENFNDYKSADTVPTIGQLYENVTDLIGNLLKLQVSVNSSFCCVHVCVYFYYVYFNFI